MKPAQSLLDERLRALADPTRREILRGVASREARASDIAGRFDMARPTISRHLKVLEDAGLVTVRRAGTARYYLSDDAALRQMARWFDDFWNDGLPELKRLAEAEDRGKPS